MAKEHRAALREVLLMGVTRLVVNKGLIEAGVEFSVKATRAEHSPITRTRTSTSPTSQHGLRAAARSASSAVRAGASSITNTNIQVNTSDKKATDDLSATLKGKVQIEFKTDYFKLDNFANMYADGGVGGAPAAARGRRRRAAPRAVSDMTRMALAHPGSRRIRGRRMLRFRIDTGTNRYYQLKLGREVRATDRGSTGSTASCTRRRSRRTRQAAGCWTRRRKLRVPPVELANAGRGFAQLFSFRTQQGRAPAFSPVVRLDRALISPGPTT